MSAADLMSAADFGSLRRWEQFKSVFVFRGIRDTIIGFAGALFPPLVVIKMV